MFRTFQNYKGSKGKTMTQKLTHKERADKLSLDIHAKVIFLTQIVPVGISERFLMEVNDLVSEAFTQVANEALEEAAKVAEDCNCDNKACFPDDIAKGIRALKQEVKA